MDRIEMLRLLDKMCLWLVSIGIKLTLLLEENALYKLLQIFVSENKYELILHQLLLLRTYQAIFSLGNQQKTLA